MIMIFVLLFGFALFADPQFSLHNSSSQEIIFDLINNSKKITVGLKQHEYYDCNNLNLSQTTTILIWDKIQGKLKYRASFAPNKNIYINWDEKHDPMLYPQEGSFFGLIKKTKLGYSIKNNISIKDINRQPNPAYENASLPDPALNNFCEHLKKEFGSDKAGMKKATQRYDPLNCQHKKEAIRNLCRDVYDNIILCYVSSK